MAKHITVVLSECKRDEPDLESVERKIAAALENRPGVSVALLPHLYDLAVDGPGVEFLRKVDGDLIVAAPLYARTIYWLLDAAEVTGRRSRSSFDTDEETEAWSAERDDEVSDRTIWCLDVRPHRQTEEALLDEIERIVAGRDAVPPAAKDAVPPAARDAVPPAAKDAVPPAAKDAVPPAAKDAVPPAAKDAVPPAARDAVPPASDATTVVDESVSFRWYPVVDYDRCTNCLECLNFCLFGVFGVDASGGLLVEQPDACRDGCPACARVCPSGAIMFPRHDDRAMAGDPKAPVGGGGGLVQLLGDLNSMDTAATERDHAVAEKAGAEEDDLDQLVDDLDEMDL